MRILIVTLLLFATGCSTMGLPGKEFWSYNPQNTQGGTIVEFKNADVRIDWSDFKDKAIVKMEADLNSDGNVDFKYQATDIVGSDAAAIRAEVEKVFSDNAAEVSPEIIDRVVDVITGM